MTTDSFLCCGLNGEIRPLNSGQPELDVPALENYYKSLSTEDLVMIHAESFSPEMMDMYRNLLRERIQELTEKANEAYSEGGDPVNLSTGNFSHSKVDLETPGMLPLVFQRFYNAIDLTEGDVGENWSHNYHIRMETKGDTVEIIFPDNPTEKYHVMGEDVFVQLPDRGGSLKKSTSGYIMTSPAQTQYFFDFEGKLLAFMDQNGNKTELFYTDGLLTNVENICGKLFLVYDLENHLIMVSDHTGRQSCFEYSGNRLIKATLPYGAVINYEYNILGRISVISDITGVPLLRNEYDTTYRTIRQSYADGGVYDLSYNDEKLTTIATEQNGNIVKYVRDEQYRTVQTIYSDSREWYEYNDHSQRTLLVDRNGNQWRFAYDQRGNIIRMTDPQEQVTQIDYNHQNKPVALIRPNNSTEEYIWDSRGNLISRRDPLGNQWGFICDSVGSVIIHSLPDGSMKTFTYDERGNVLAAVDARGFTTAYEYDDLNRIVKKTTPAGHVTGYAYSDTGYLSVVTNPAGDLRKFSYDLSGKLTKVTDFDGSVTGYSYNSVGKLVEKTDHYGGKTKYIYDLMWNLIGVTDPLGYQWRNQYNKLGRLSRVIDEEGSLTKYEYDPKGNITAIVTPLGARTEIAYDSLDRPHEMRGPDGAVTRCIYDPRGNLIEVVDPLEGKTKMCYNQADQLISVTNSIGLTTKYTYNPLGLPETIVDPVGGKQFFSYYPGGLLKSMSMSGGDTKRFEYDQNGNVRKITNSLGHVTNFTYDCLDRVVAITDPMGGVKSFVYDSLDRITSLTDENGNNTEISYSPTGEIEQIVNPIGHKTKYGYDANHRLISMEHHRIGAVDNTGKHDTEVLITTWLRNRRGEIVEECSPFGYRKKFNYDPAGNLISVTDFDGLETMYEYDLLGNITKVIYPEGKTIEINYDLLGRMIRMDDWLGTTTIHRDLFGRIKRITDYEGRAVTYELDAIGRCTGIIYPDHSKVNYQWNAAGHLQSVTSSEGETLLRYDPLGRLQERLLSGNMSTKYDWDPLGRLTLLAHTVEGRVVDRFVYTYDPAGNLTKIDKDRTGLPAERGLFCFNYDSLGRLTGEVGPQGNKLYRYDSMGNRIMSLANGIETKYIYNGCNQLVYVQEGETLLTNYYDRRGNLTQVTENSSVIANYKYDSTNRLIGTVTTEGSVEYIYNGFLKRVKRLETPQAEPMKEISYILDLTRSYNDLLAIEGEKTQRFIWADTALATEGTEHIHFLPDHLGSPIRLIGRGKCVALAYDEFGTQIAKTGDSLPNPFGFSGYQYDNVSGLYFAQARYYKSSWGRFLSEDFVREGINYYTHCYNNPLRFVDRNGLWSEDTHLGETSKWANYFNFFDQDDSVAIGRADYSVDTSIFTSPLIPLPWMQQNHFNRNPASSIDSRQEIADIRLATAIDLYNNGQRDEALRALGRGLHPLQDIQAHGNYGVGNPIAEHIQPGHGKKVDDPEYDWADSNRNSVVYAEDRKNGLRILRTELATIEYLTQFITAVCPF